MGNTLLIVSEVPLAVLLLGVVV